MKFPHLRIGQRFELDGEIYVKTGPMVASHEGTGAMKMVRRSAEVRVLDETAQTVEETAGETILLRQAREALEAYHNGARRILADEDTRRELEALYRRCLGYLSGN